ncbi:hypothetical protein QTO34_006974 [Cnephaeus nilssonii]|uniref:Inter-alpha-trypsin inhibitor heavy chain H1 n=1 Tax=Cnephaeus nilssonii TaxID=3371016 RepID=A0AA40HKI2_CNENI|nr:hypothetical protein QTO34_006974 [Eptesicus nilssonii]
MGLRGLLCVSLVSLLTLQALPAQASPQRPKSSETVDGVVIRSLKVHCKVTSRFAHTVITSQVVNSADQPKEVAFDVEIPKTAFISDFAITANGKAFIGDIKEKAVAWKQYRKAAVSGENAGLVRASGRTMEQFTIHLTIGPRSKAMFRLTYEDVLKRKLMQYDIDIKVKPKQLVHHFEVDCRLDDGPNGSLGAGIASMMQIDVDIFEPQGIRKLDVQTSFLPKELATQLIKKSFSGKEGHVLFRPTVGQQQSCSTCSSTLLNGEFKVTYDVNRDQICDLLVANNYFAHFFAPQNLTSLNKNLVFVIDISNSMEGQKVKQTKEALLKILEDIRPGDYFDLVLFGSQVQSWRGSLVPASAANLQAAQDFVRRFSLAGSTNLNGGLLLGIEILNKGQRGISELSNHAPILIMLTDGEPTEGVTDRTQILKNIRNAIGGKFPLYNLGFGQDVDFSFLEVMSMENNGRAQRIYEDHDASQQLQGNPSVLKLPFPSVQGFYNQVATPLLVDVELQYPKDTVSELTQHSHKQYYEGSEIVVAGRIADQKLSSFKADVRAHADGREFKTTCLVDEEEMKKLLRERGHMLENHVERLWAYLTIQELLAKRMKLEGEEKAKLLAKALQMSLAYQFVTPLTSMTMRGLVDEDGLEPVIDKPTEGMISAVGEAVGLGEASGGFNSPPFLSLPGSPLEMLGPKRRDRTGRPPALGQTSLPTSGEASRALCPLLLRWPQGWEGPQKRSQQLRGGPAAFLLNAIHSCRSAFVLPAWQQPSPTRPTVPEKIITSGESLGGSEGHPAGLNPGPAGTICPLPNLMDSMLFPVDTDPHFIIHVPQKEDALCFNINEEPGVVLNLVQDPNTGFSVNAQLIGDKARSPGQHEGTYFGRLGIANPVTDFQLEVTPQNITLNPGSHGPVFSWRDQASLRQDGVVMTINRKRNLVVSVEDGGTFEVVLHRVWKGSAIHQDFLGFYVLDSHRMSARTHGLLGQFFHPFDYKVSDLHPGSDPTKTDATMVVKNQRLTVTRGLQKDYSKDPRHGTEVTCWFVHNNGAGLIDGVHTDYIVPDIF